MIAIIKKNKEKVIFLGVAIILLLFVSQCSFLFRISNSVDSNMFLLGGKEILSGKHAYTEFFEQKGIIVYLVHAVALLLFKNSFHGIYFLEILSLYCFYFYAYKTIKEVFLDIEEHKAILFTLISVSLVFFSSNITNCDQVEEFSLPLIMYFIYHISKYIYKGELEKRVYIIIGLHIGILFWSKYLALLTHFVLFCLFIGCLIKRKEIKNVAEVIKGLFIGFSLITCLVLVYFIVTGTFLAMCDVYFYQNIFNYKRQGVSESKLKFLIKFISTNKFIIPIYLSCLFGSFLKVKKNLFLSLILSTHLLTIFFLTCCNAWQYYYIPTYVFIPVEFVYLMGFLKERLQYISIVVCIGLMLGGYIDHYNYHNLNYNTAKQYKIADIIRQSPDPSLLVLCYDEGYYLAADLLPTDYFFERTQVHEDIILNRYIEMVFNNEIQYVIIKHKGNKDHTDIDWSYERNCSQKEMLEEHGYEMIYFCDDVGRDDYMDKDSMVVLYKMRGTL